MRTELVSDALRMAWFRRRPEAGLILHSDRGSQGGFNRSSQHWIVEQILGARPGLPQASSRQAFCGAWNSVHWQRPGSLQRSTETGLCPLEAVRVLVRAALPWTVRVSEEYLHPGFDREASVIG